MRSAVCSKIRLFVVRWCRALKVSELQAHNTSQRAALWACTSAIVDQQHRSTAKHKSASQLLSLCHWFAMSRGLLLIKTKQNRGSEVIWTKLDPVDDIKKRVPNTSRHFYYHHSRGYYATTRGTVTLIIVEIDVWWRWRWCSGESWLSSWGKLSFLGAYYNIT